MVITTVLLLLGLTGIFGTLGNGIERSYRTIAARNHLLVAVLDHTITNPDISAGNVPHSRAALAAILCLGRGLLRGLKTQGDTEVGERRENLASHLGRNTALALHLLLLGHCDYPFHKSKIKHLYIQL